MAILGIENQSDVHYAMVIRDMMNTFLEIKIPTANFGKEEAIDMCKAWEEQRAEGRTEGLIEERIHTLLEFDKTPDECINDIEKRYNLSEEKARAYFEKFGAILA